MIDFLLNLGFVRAGQCMRAQERFVIEVLPEFRNQVGLLYAFVSHGTVCYIGKTSQSMSDRLYGYERPGGQQRTNFRIHGEIMQTLWQDREVEVFAFVNRNLLQYQGLQINLAAGLEDALIRHVAEHNSQNNLPPLWNAHGNPYYLGGNRTADAVEEQEAENRPYDSEGEVMGAPLEPVDAHVAPPAGSHTEPAGSHTEPEFEVKLTDFLIKQHFINVRSRFRHLIGQHGERMIVHLPDRESITGTVYKKNNDLRIQLGPGRYNQWLRDSNLVAGQRFRVTILSPNEMRFG